MEASTGRSACADDTPRVLRNFRLKEHHVKTEHRFFSRTFFLQDGDVFSQNYLLNPIGSTMCVELRIYTQNRLKINAIFFHLCQTCAKMHELKLGNTDIFIREIQRSHFDYLKKEALKRRGDNENRAFS